mgnify:CR=1 FL=1
MKITIYSTSWCGPCSYAKKLLDEKGLAYDEVDIEKENISREKLAEIANGHTVPQIIINEKPIGGFDSLLKLNQSGQLDEIISNEN